MAIRFNIFQLFQNYNGRNPKLNIGPKVYWRKVWWFNVLGH